MADRHSPEEEDQSEGSRGGWTVLANLAHASTADRRRAIAAFFLFATFMAAYYIFKPVRGSLYLHYVGADNLPYAYLLSMVVAFVAMTLYNRVYVLLDARRLYVAGVVGLVLSGVLFYGLNRTGWVDPGLFSFLLFLWVSIHGTLSATLFWSVTNNNFNVQTGRLLYGFIGCGGIVGALVGGAITKTLLEHSVVVTEELLLVASALLLLALPLVRAVRGEAQQAPPSVSPNNPSAEAAPKRDGLYWIFGDRYVSGIALLVLLMTFSGTLLDLQFNRIVGETLTDKEQKTVFFGQLYAWVNVIGLVIQLSVTSAVHRWYGPIPGLLVLPIIVMISAVALFRADLPTVTVIWVGLLATTYSINQASKELLYVPTPQAVRFGAKGYIDVFVYRAGDASASVVSILAKAVFGLATSSLGVVVLILAPISVAVIGFLRPAYRARAAAAFRAASVMGSKVSDN